MSNFNKVILMGNLTRDPELRYTGTGVPVVNFGLAVNNRYKTQSGELKNDVCYINVVVFGKQAVPCNDYLKKGSPVFVEGRLQSRSWESNGQKRSTIEVVSNRIQFIGKKESEADSAGNEERVANEEPVSELDNTFSEPVEEQ